MKSKIFQFGKVKKHSYPLPIFTIQFMFCLLETPNQWCLAYKRFRFLFIQVMWFSPLCKI